MPCVAAEGGVGSDDCGQRLTAVGMSGGHAHHGSAGRANDVQCLDKLLVRHIVSTREDGCAAERLIVLVLQMSSEQQSDVVLFADVDDVVG